MKNASNFESPKPVGLRERSPFQATQLLAAQLLLDGQLLTVEWRYPSHHPFVDGIFGYKPSTLGIPHFWKPPYRSHELVTMTVPKPSPKMDGL